MENIDQHHAGASSTGYGMFVALACIFGFVFAVAIGCDLIRKSKRHSAGKGLDNEHAEVRNVCTQRAVQLVMLILLGFSASLYVWGCFARAQGNKSHDPNKFAAGLACILFGLAGILASYPFIACRLRRDVSMNVLVLAVYFLIVPGFVLLALSVKRMSQSAEYESMTMMITNSRTQFESSIECKYGGITCDGYRGQIEVSWSPKWSCPDSPSDLVCSAWVTEPTCDQYTHADGTFVLDDVSASISAQECIQKQFHLLDFGKQEIVNKEELDLLNPSSSRLTMVDAYGSCSASCKATLETMDDLVWGSKIAGFVMNLLGVFLAIWVSLFRSPESQHVRSENDDYNEETEHSESQDTSSSLHEADSQDQKTDGKPEEPQAQEDCKGATRTITDVRKWLYLGFEVVVNVVEVWLVLLSEVLGREEEVSPGQFALEQSSGETADGSGYTCTLPNGDEHGTAMHDYDEDTQQRPHAGLAPIVEMQDEESPGNSPAIEEDDLQQVEEISFCEINEETGQQLPVLQWAHTELCSLQTPDEESPRNGLDNNEEDDADENRLEDSQVVAKQSIMHDKEESKSDSFVRQEQSPDEDDQDGCVRMQSSVEENANKDTIDRSIPSCASF